MSKVSSSTKNPKHRTDKIHVSRNREEQLGEANNHEQVGENDPDTVLLSEDELKNKPNDGELEKSSEDSIDHLLLKAKVLEEGEKNSHQDNGGGCQGLEHSLEELHPDVNIH